MLAESTKKGMIYILSAFLSQEIRTIFAFTRGSMNYVMPSMEILTKPDAALPAAGGAYLYATLKASA